MRVDHRTSEGRPSEGRPSEGSPRQGRPSKGIPSGMFLAHLPHEGLPIIDLLSQAKVVANLSLIRCTQVESNDY